MLELKDICYKVETEQGIHQILDHVSLQVRTGEIIVITGPNGSGKSTLAKIIMGIIKPTSGEIWLEGNNITNLGVTERANLGIGYTFQQPPRFKGITVKKLLEVAAGRSLTYDEACTYLSQVGICAKDYLNREANASLSGGEMKRIELATQMIRGSKFTVFDEPEAGIDLWSFSMLINAFQELKKESKFGLIIISHQEKLIELSDELLLLSEGRIDKKGKPSGILGELHCSRLKL